MSPPSQTQKVVAPLLRLLHLSAEIERVVLSYLLMVSRTLSVSEISIHVLVALIKPSYSQDLLVNSYAYLLVRANDTSQVKKDKMRLLKIIIRPDNYQSLLREFIVRGKARLEPLST